MTMGPDDLACAEFPVGLRGYDRDAVDSLLGTAAQAWRDSLAMVGRAVSPPPPPPPFPVVAPEEPLAPPVDHDATPDEPVPLDVRGPAEAPHGDPDEPPRGPTSIPGLAAATIAGSPPDDAPVPPDPDPARASRAATADSEEADRRIAWAERVAAELDRANARAALGTAQEEAVTILADAQARADRMLAGTEERAREQIRAALADARGRLEALTVAEREAHDRIDKVRESLEDLPGMPPNLGLPTVDEIIGDAATDART